MTTKQIVLASRPNGMPTPANFRFEDYELPDLKAGKVLLKGWYYSVDPYIRGRMSDAKSYVPPIQVSKPIEGSVIARVIESKTDSFTKDDLVLAMLPQSREFIAEGKGLQKIDSSATHVSYHLGILGMTGLTAYFGLLDIGKPKSAETVVVSGAAGAVGMVVGQISSYNDNVVPIGPRPQSALLRKSALIQGFLVGNYASRFPEGVLHLAEWLRAGKLKYRETIIKGFERLPDAFISLFEGGNTGKMLVETE